MEERYDVIVVGMGIAGNPLAYALAKQGKKVLAIERDLSQPDKIIGELLQPGGVASLTALGLQDCLEFDEIDSPKILGYAVFPPNGDAVRLPYPKVDGVMPRGRSFHHGRFIQNLRKRTKEVADVKEATVTGLIEEEGRVIGVEWKAKNSRARGKSFADFVFVCDGMFSNFRENFTDQQVSHTSKFFGLVLEDAATDLPFSNHGHVFLLKPTPTLIYPISSTDVRVLVDIPEPCPKSLEDVKEYLRNVTAPQLPEKVRAMFLEAVEKASKVKSMPCGKMHPKPLVKKGAAIVGDSFNVRHPLTGGGMTVALNDVMILNDILGRPEFSFRNDRQVEKAMVEWYSRRKGIASQINILAQALYNVFSNENLRIAVINYLNLGGEAVAGPMSIFGGLKNSPTSLIAHFFAVAFHGTFNWLVPFPWPSNVLNAADTLTSATSTIVPLMVGEHLLNPAYPNVAKL